MTKKIVLLLVLYSSSMVCPKPHRAKRQSCEYEIKPQDDGKSCCPCAPGQYQESPCSKNENDTNCQYCVPGKTYNSHANILKSCEPCTSCNPNVNLVEVNKCTIYQNTVCQCQEGFFCVDGRESCSSCHPCNICGDEGIEVPCTATNDTKCSDVKEHGGRILLVLIPVVVCILVCIAVFFYLWKKKDCFETSTNPVNPTQRPPEVELQLLPKGLDLQPHIYDIAEKLGWLDMKQVAERSGMSDTNIQSHQINYPNNCQEQCISLLKAWVEREGLRNSSEKLIKILFDMKKKAKAENILEILNRGNGVSGGNIRTETPEIQ
ncbi:tumor necrosis factor receptor superfamily member 6 isoform X2 [Esox lucius]|uniref:tumor necrosis factor receptor superfamily member 6 isoform X2 n=1 Tax=Esox lucius TaxID=8010 RepID=UPI0014772A0F|nr:tumor necrosis factor receptor superfamily member 6 isoform X2 [Esox lucius]